ncbi:hypothetical protein H6789_02355 [Candidatus Nomurabacteria bacterium]|nr:hypothetical protein [Candidatus Nomurabacteria bacterium]
MKRTERDRAILLRKQGKSLNEIVEELKVSKGSVSLWVRDVRLTESQRAKLNKRGFSVSAIEKRRLNRIDNTILRHRLVIDEAKGDVQDMSRYELLLVGTALYWGEGSKANRNVASIANSDPSVIRMMMRFFKEILEVNQTKFRGHIHTFSHLNVDEAESYWSKVSGIPRTQFYKTYSKLSKASLRKKDSLPYGTFQIYVCDTNVALKIKGWMERLAELGDNPRIR